MEDHRRAAVPLDLLDRLGVAFVIERGSRFVTDERPGHILTVAHDFLGFREGAFLRLGVDQIAEAGVHVHGGGQIRRGGALNMGAETRPIDRAIGAEGQ